MTTNNNPWPPRDLDAELSDAEIDQLFTALAESTTPITPQAETKNAIFSAIENVEQVAPEPTATTTASVVELSSYAKRRNQVFFAVAAVVALVALASMSIPLITSDSTEEKVTIAAGHESMHEIMDSDDAQTENMAFSGVELEVVSSDAMDKAGAMVQGAPTVKDGMGVQVWSVDESGDMSSAGVIGPEDHKDVWMPFKSATTKVILTEEPLAGSTKPTGTVLGEMTF